jgi:hypothetical protein
MSSGLIAGPNYHEDSSVVTHFLPSVVFDGLEQSLRQLLRAKMAVSEDRFFQAFDRKKLPSLVGRLG